MDATTAERKRRVKTGCLTCRQRRVKCDERKPTCQRCEAANIECSGYQIPRKIPLKRRATNDEANGQKAVNSTSTLPGNPLGGSPLVAYPNNPNDSQRPHLRAREVLAHHQYSYKTAALLFREDHLYFWRDQVLEAAWDTEFVYDAVVALGTMHRAVLLLSKPNDKWRGLDTKVIAFQAYGNALRQISGLYGKYNSQYLEMMIAVLLLLTYFECFAGNPAAALGHLRTARQHLFEAKSSPLPNREPLFDCVDELGLVAQIVLPLGKLSFTAYRDAASIDHAVKKCSTAAEEMKQLFAFISAHKSINKAIWTPLSKAEAEIDPQVLLKFQADLLRWKTESTHTFQVCRESTKSDPPVSCSFDRSFLENYTIPPKPHHFPDMDSALAAALFNCYMGRTMWMISKTTGGDESCEITAYWYTYHNLQIIEGVWREDDDRKLEERQYLPCNAIKIGFIPLLYLSAHICYDSTWQQYITAKLYSLSQEGLYNGEAYAIALESLALFQSHVDRTSASKVHDTDRTTRSPAKARSSTIVPILIPDTNGQDFVAYYLWAVDSGADGRSTPIEIVGRARWNKSSDSTSRNLSIEFFQNTHPISKGLSNSSVYEYLASQEPIAQRWESIAHTRAYGSDGSSSILAGSASDFSEEVSPYSTFTP